MGRKEIVCSLRRFVIRLVLVPLPEETREERRKEVLIFGNN